MAESCCDVFAILGSAVLPKRSKIIFLDHNPERLLQPTQFIFIQAVSLDEHQYVQLPYINISLQHFKLIQKFGSSFLSDTCVSIITFFLQSTKKHAKISHSTQSNLKQFWGKSQDLFCKRSWNEVRIQNFLSLSESLLENWDQVTQLKKNFLMDRKLDAFKIYFSIKNKSCVA